MLYPQKNTILEPLFRVASYMELFHFTTKVNRARYLAANLISYLCLNLFYEGKGNGGKSEEGGNLISVDGEYL